MSKVGSFYCSPVYMKLLLNHLLNKFFFVKNWFILNKLPCNCVAKHFEHLNLTGFTKKNYVNVFYFKPVFLKAPALKAALIKCYFLRNIQK